MITRERIKEEIDKIEDNYLDVIFHIVQSFEYAPPIQNYSTRSSLPKSSDNTLKEWHDFVDATYGILASDPIMRGTQGEYEVREAIR